MSSTYLGFLDIIPALIWLIIFLVFAYFKRNENEDKAHFKYYLPNLYSKLFFSLLFALVYIYYYGGGDTTAYFDGAVVLNNIFLKSPSLYFDVMTSPFSYANYGYVYDSHTGFPPGWIFREPESFFVAKLLSLFSFFTLKSYFAMTFIMAYITSIAAWKLYELVRSFQLNNERLLAFGLLLLPSVNFWCAGVSKDTVVFVATLFLVYHAFHIISKHLKATLWNYVYAILAAVIIYQIRSFILAAIALPMVFSLSTRIIRFLGGGDIFVIAFRSIVLIVGLGIAGRGLIASNEKEFLDQSAYLQEASVIQQDFAQNKLYGEKRYSIGDIVFTPVGLIRVAPFAVLAGLYRPYPWEALSPTLLLNGLESIMFLYFTFLLFKQGFRKKWRLIRTHEFLIFCLIFVFVIAFMSGLTSGLYGVLVRLRAPLLPFFFILMTLRSPSEEEETKESLSLP